MEKVLIIGANGFLGTNLIKAYEEDSKFQKNFSLTVADIENSNIPETIPFFQLDITKKEEVSKILSKINPDIIILTAALTDVDKCEVEKQLAFKVNVQGPQNIIKACKELGTKLVFISTDFVFDGTKPEPYIEEDIPNPQSYYAKTKFQAELSIYSSGIDYLICRTAVLYGWNQNKLNFITWILDNLEKKKPLRIVTEQINSPTYVENLAKCVFKLLELGASGIYHTAGDCILSRYEMALKCAEIFDNNKDLIKPIQNLKQKAERPRNAGLNITKLKTKVRDQMKILNLEEGLKRMRTSKENYI